jgi:hypothetical protein
LGFPFEFFEEEYNKLNLAEQLWFCLRQINHVKI